MLSVTRLDMVTINTPGVMAVLLDCTTMLTGLYKGDHSVVGVTGSIQTGLNPADFFAAVVFLCVFLCVTTYIYLYIYI